MDKDANHSVQELPVEASYDAPSKRTIRYDVIERKTQLDLPPASNHRWTQLDEDLEIILDSALKGEANRKMKVKSQVVSSMSGDLWSQRD